MGSANSCTVSHRHTFIVPRASAAREAKPRRESVSCLSLSGPFGGLLGLLCLVCLASSMQGLPSWDSATQPSAVSVSLIDKQYSFGIMCPRRVQEERV